MQWFGIVVFFILNRVLSVTGSFLMHAMYMPMNFLIAIIPAIIGLLYSFIRTLTIPPFIDSQGNQNQVILLMLNVVLTFVFCAYVSRRAFVSDFCNYHFANVVKKIEQNKVDVRRLASSNEKPSRRDSNS